MSGLTYLAGPIDSKDPEATDWRAEAKELLSPFPCYDPAGAFHFPSVPPVASYDTKRAVSFINREAIMRCEFVLAYLDSPNCRPFGTIREIEWARHEDLPVVVVGEWLHRHFEAHDLDVHTNLQGACSWIKTKMQP